TVKGRITVEGRNVNASTLGELRLSLRRFPPSSRPEPLKAGYSNPLPGGSFVLEAGAGDFRVNIAPILNVTPKPFTVEATAALRDTYVKSIRFGNTDVLNTALHLERPTDSLLEIVLGGRPGTVDGVVSDGRGQPAGDAVVVLVPSVRSRSELYRNGITDSGGRFRFDGIPPGDYKLFAWTDIENGSWYDAEVMKEYENRGTVIRIPESGAEAVQLVAIQ